MVLLTHWSKRRATSLGLGKRLLASLSSISASLQLGLSLLELGQVEGSNLLCLLNLLLVGADLALQLVNQGLYSRKKENINCLFYY